MEYHEIGERFEFNGVVLEVIEAAGCASCFFSDYMICKLKDEPKYCGVDTRNDNKCISYKLVEQCKPKDMEQKTEIDRIQEERDKIIQYTDFTIGGTDKVFATHKTNIKSDEEIYGSLLDKLFTTYKAKDADYGSAFAEMFDELGIDYAYGKLREKMNRIKTLRKQLNMVENEGLEDALLDTAGYSILTLVELKKRKGNGTNNYNMKVRRKNMRCDKFEYDMEKDIPYAFKEAIEDNKRMKDAILLFNQYLRGNFSQTMLLDCNDNAINGLINKVADGIKELKINYDGKSE